MKKGKLFLIPTTLGESDPEMVIPAKVLQVSRRLVSFIAENERSARRYLKRIGTEIPLDEIVPKLVAITKSGYEVRIFVRGDRNTDYGTIMKVMATISAAGFRRIALVTEAEEKR